MTEEGEMVELDTELLAQLEKEAASRYTEEDSHFMEHCNKGMPKPPIVPAERFDRNRQHRGNFRNQDYRRGGNYRDHRRDYSDMQGNYGGNHRDHSDYRRDSSKRDYGGNRRRDEYGRRDHETGRY